MLILFLPLGAGAAVGLLRGGRLRHLASLHLRATALVVCAVALELTLRWTDASLHLGILLTTYALVGGWLVVNWAGRGRWLRVALGLIAVGACLNLAAIAPSHGMPVSTSALGEVAGAAPTSIAQGHLSKHVPSTSASPLRWLGDAIPLASLRAVISVGDVALAAGIALFVAAAMGTEADEAGARDAQAVAPTRVRQSPSRPAMAVGGRRRVDSGTRSTIAR